MSKVTEWIFSHQWTITPAALGAILEIAEKRMCADIDPAIFHKDFDTMLDSDFSKMTSNDKLKIGSVEKVIGEEIDGAFRAVQRGKVAIIPVRGPIFPRANLFTSWSGGTSIDMLTRDFNIALERPDITSIIFDIDSPGGEITGQSEFAEMVFNAQGKKRILTYVSGLAASGAYWIGSSTSEIISTNTGLLGSIGVVAAYRDTSARDEKQGIKNIDIVSSISPKKRYDIKTNDGKTIVQKILDDLADIFVSAISKHRGTNAEDVISNFGQGDIIIAQSAIDVGMADRIGSFESLIEQENSKPNSFNIGGLRMDTLIKDGTVDSVKAENPELFKAIHNMGKADVATDAKAAKEEGIKEGVTQERARIEGIESLSSTETMDIVNENKFKGDQTKESVALLIVDRDKAKAKKTGDDVIDDAEEAGKAGSKIDGSSETSKEEDKKRTASNIAAGMNAHRA